MPDNSERGRPLLLYYSIEGTSNIKNYDAAAVTVPEFRRRVAYGRYRRLMVRKYTISWVINHDKTYHILS